MTAYLHFVLLRITSMLKLEGFKRFFPVSEHSSKDYIRLFFLIDSIIYPNSKNLSKHLPCWFLAVTEQPQLYRPLVTKFGSALLDINNIYRKIMTENSYCIYVINFYIHLKYSFSKGFRGHVKIVVFPGSSRQPRATSPCRRRLSTAETGRLHGVIQTAKLQYHLRMRTATSL